MSKRPPAGSTLAAPGSLSRIVFLAFVGCHGGRGTGTEASVIADPNVADVCTWSGNTEGVVNGVCPLREDGWAWIAEMFVYAPMAGEASLESCPITDDAYRVDLDTPGWLLRVDKVLPSGVEDNTTDHFASGVVATRLDGPVPCAVKLVWVMKQQLISLPVGSVVRYSQRYTIINVETDAFRTNVLRDENGALLVGWVVGIRPQVWDSDMWPELALSFASPPVCQKAGYPDALALRLTLSNGQDTCTLDSQTARCCTFSGVPYEVISTDAWHSVSGERPDYANILVARQDILVPAP